MQDPCSVSGVCPKGAQIGLRIHLPIRNPENQRQPCPAADGEWGDLSRSTSALILLLGFEIMTVSWRASRGIASDFSHEVPPQISPKWLASTEILDCKRGQARILRAIRILKPPMETVSLIKLAKSDQQLCLQSVQRLKLYELNGTNHPAF